MSLEEEYNVLDKDKSGRVIEIRQGISAYLGLFLLSIMSFWWGVDSNWGTGHNPSVHMITAFSIEIFLRGLKKIEWLEIRNVFRVGANVLDVAVDLFLRHLEEIAIYLDRLAT